MKRWPILAAMIATGLMISGADAQQPSPSSYPVPSGTPAPNPFRAPTDAPPSCRFPVTKEAGDWLICVQTFKGAQSRMLAEEMVEVLMRDYKLSAFIYDRGYKERLEESKRVQEVRDKYWDSIEAMQKQGIEPVGPLRYRTMRIPDEYAVLVGKPRRPFTDMDTAREFLTQLRKQKPPPDRFSTAVFFADEEPGGKKFKPSGSEFLNPFTTAMVVHNPTIEFKKDQADPEKADEFLKELNAQESLSVLKCSKPWTLVVKVYQGQTVYQSPKSPSIMSRIGLAKKEPELLNASAAQAHSTAEFLRKMNPSFEAYVMHHRSYSLVTVGQYESTNDPNLLANQKALAALQLTTKANGVVLETLNPQPLPMKIPR